MHTCNEKMRCSISDRSSSHDSFSRANVEFISFCAFRLTLLRRSYSTRNAFSSFAVCWCASWILICLKSKQQRKQHHMLMNEYVHMYTYDHHTSSFVHEDLQCCVAVRHAFSSRPQATRRRRRRGRRGMVRQVNETQ
jgi:hypothetical protein